MLNIWHIYHTKHKIGVLWDVSNLKNYTTWLQYRCKFATVWTDVVKYLLFYIPISLSSLFIFSFLFSLTLRFPLSSPCISSLPLRPVRDVHPQWRRHSSDDDGVAPTTTARSATLNLTSATQSHSSHSISPMLSHAWSRRSHLEAVVDLTLSHSTSLWLWVFFFFAAIWVDLMVVVGCGLWAVTVAVVVGCGGDGPLLSVWIDGYLFVWIGAESMVVWHLGGGCAWWLVFAGFFFFFSC